MSSHREFLTELRRLTAEFVASIKRGRATVSEAVALADARQQLMNAHEIDLELEPASAHDRDLAKQIERLDAEVHRFCRAHQAEVTRALILRPKTPKGPTQPRILSHLA